MIGVIPLLPEMPSWHGKGQIYLDLEERTLKLCVSSGRRVVSVYLCYSRMRHSPGGLDITG